MRRPSGHLPFRGRVLPYPILYGLAKVRPHLRVVGVSRGSRDQAFSRLRDGKAPKESWCPLLLNLVMTLITILTGLLILPMRCLLFVLP